jgi:tRNA (adenine22-N1)-methyltransferase
MTLSKRLREVASFVDSGATIADVGSDHAELPIALLEEGKIRSAVAIENKPGPYSRMKNAVLSSPFEAEIKLSLSDGISFLPPEVDTLVIAGMGGKNIIKILSDHPENLSKVKSLILDAHSEREALIAFLGRISFRVEAEDFFYDEGIAYDVIKAVKNKGPIDYNEQECRFGPSNLKHPNPDFILYWRQEKNRYEEILKNPALPSTNRKDYEAIVASIKEAIHGN